MFTGHLQKDWDTACALWLQSDCLLQAEIGPKWETPPQHYACIEFAQRHPDSKNFLIQELAHPNPLIAAYAFKCLIRICDLRSGDVAGATLARKDRITIHHHSSKVGQSLQEFFDGYFAQYSGRDELLEEQQRTQDWQDNQLAQYKRSSQSPPPPKG